MNSLGIEVLQQKVEGYQSEINVSNLPSGVYYVQFNSTKSMTSKMVTVYH
ncbi:MAG: T9SS type A sorting domain-containing protein [Bacteroidetes bacterium]|nr:T9SS type A sorting domain-containing protein [Bacteroidota bacterium]